MCLLSIFVRKITCEGKQSLVLMNHTVICVAFGAAGGNKQASASQVNFKQFS